MLFHDERDLARVVLLFFFWIHYYFEEVLHLGKDKSRVFAAILTLAMAVGMILGGWLADRLWGMTGSRKSTALVPALGLFVGGILLVLGVLAQETVWIVTLLAFALAAVGATAAPVWTMAVELGRHRGGTAAAICNTGGNAGGRPGRPVSVVLPEKKRRRRIGVGQRDFH
jgi:sugar phosphate permease